MAAKLRAIAAKRAIESIHASPLWTIVRGVNAAANGREEMEVGERKGQEGEGEGEGEEGKVEENEEEGAEEGEGEAGGIAQESSACKRRRVCWKYGAKRELLDNAVDIVLRDAAQHQKKSWADYAILFGINKSVLLRAFTKRSRQITEAEMKEP